MANFESFSRRQVSLKPEPHLTIQKRGLVSINRPAFVALESPVAVELLYDRDARVFGLRPVEPGADNAYLLRRAASSISGPWIVSAMAFTKFYEIDTTVSRRWPAHLDDGVLCADLTRPGTPVTSNRAVRHPE